jgi:hypothetical protein
MQQFDQDEFVLRVFILRNGEDSSVESLGMRPLGGRNPEVLLAPMDLCKLLFDVESECPHHLLAKGIDPDSGPSVMASTRLFRSYCFLHPWMFLRSVAFGNDFVIKQWDNA